MSAQWWAIQNEVRMAPWAQGSKVPIRAFFYLSGDGLGLDRAKSDQTRYKSTFDAFAPIIRLTLPSQKGGQAEFAYDTADQAVPDPGFTPLPEPGPDTTVFDFEKIPPGEGVSQVDLGVQTGLKGTITTSCGNLYVRDTPAPDMTGHHLDFVSSEVSVSALDASTGKPFRVVELSLHTDSPIGLGGSCESAPPPLMERHGARYKLACESGGTLNLFWVTVADGKVQMDDLWFTK